MFDPAETVGVLVNINLVFFYGAPLESIYRVISTGRSDSIHPPTQLMTCTNTTFWCLYGVAIWDPVIIVPNGIGLTLGVIQGFLRCVYPSSGATVVPTRDDDEEGPDGLRRDGDFVGDAGDGNSDNASQQHRNNLL